ncbi:MAG: 16S rRNA (cytosine(1402)-N(4))-methyltransferase [Deltaproteobacteria bacterium CG11_big_fil_rev_8_21_14_0_20_47_16]|nr:MAG: 16S rRNA (cytosine(1402)-N(4))-methyltransferase [Deltaproteobacteria bacterium CG11_big_fil_rev_8_21_14_0_20_47_16]
MADHVPVMAAEVVDALCCHDGGWYVDGTLGLGGYAKMMLEASAPGGVVVGCDVDPDAIAIATERLKSFGDRIKIVCGSYATLDQYLSVLGRGAVDGICIDIGVSSLQLDTEERGFGFQREGPLDMRMDPKIPETAADLVNTADQEDLARWFWEYGEERFSRRIASTICSQRVRKPFQTTRELAECIVGAVPSVARRQRIHPATRSFQALRIVVNDELKNLERFLELAPKMLNENGHVIVVSYHSLEDRLVKQSWKRWAATGHFQILTKRPLQASEEEIEKNPRARSAKMRVLKRIGGQSL